jgi:hypothetical protein
MTLNLNIRRYRGQNMKVRCVANTGAALLPGSKRIEKLISKEYSIEIGREYAVYCMSMWKGSLDYLLEDDGPYWYPADLFEVVDPLMPPLWYFTFRVRNVEYEFMQAIWGYKEMIIDTGHHDALTLHESDALDIFAKRKEEIDEWQELQSAK